MGWQWPLSAALDAIDWLIFVILNPFSIVWVDVMTRCPSALEAWLGDFCHFKPLQYCMGWCYDPLPVSARNLISFFFWWSHQCSCQGIVRFYYLLQLLFIIMCLLLLFALLRYSPYKLDKNPQRFPQCSIVKLCTTLFCLSKEGKANDETTWKIGLLVRASS